MANLHVMAKRLCVFILLAMVMLGRNLLAQPGNWTWMKGSSSTMSTGNFGPQGVFLPSNEPPSLYEACSWTDLQGNFWLFGGILQTTFAMPYNTLWKYDVALNQWAWITGSNTPNGVPAYGTMGVPSVNNTPSNHAYGALTWTDNTGNFWLFGGLSIDATGNQATMDVLWRFNPVTLEWTWIRGSNIGTGTGNYGVQSVPSPSNDPPGRMESTAAWTDNQGDLWMFGGAVSFGQSNDLWRYNIATNMWTWMDGSSLPNAPIAYGPRGVESPSFDPGGRMAYAHGIDLSGNLYIYGGYSSAGVLTDMWRYNVSTGNWAWLGGSTLMSDSGNYVCQCGIDEENNPGSGLEMKACWSDDCGIWLYGGGGQNVMLSALWYFEFNSASFSLVKENQPTSYGTQTVTSASNSPPPRYGVVPWRSNNGDLWIFGGMWNTGTHNDLWKFEVEPDCVCSDVSCFDVIAAPNVFTPDGDGMNDNFIIRGLTARDRVEIFNRWGEQVFESTDNNIGWDGTRNEGAACVDGVYYFLVYNEKGELLTKGFLHLIR